MARKLPVEVYDVDGILVITNNVDASRIDDYVMSIPNWYDAGEIIIDGKWFYLDELKDIIKNKIK